MLPLVDLCATVSVGIICFQTAFSLRPPSVTESSIYSALIAQGYRTLIAQRYRTLIAQRYTTLLAQRYSIFIAQAANGPVWPHLTHDNRNTGSHWR